MIFRKVFVTFFMVMAAMAAIAQNSIYYVKATVDVTQEIKDGKTADGSSWEQAMTLTDALEKAVAGDQIWVKGYNNPSFEQLYTIPRSEKTRPDGFLLKAGVKMYGGFVGTESTIAARPIGNGTARYKHTYQSCLVADGEVKDTVSNELLIYPENTTRADNARHVLVMDLTSATAANKTVLDGFVIAAGNADGSVNEDNGRGGGVLVKSDATNNGGSYEISQCFFVNNYGARGGAIYVDENVQAANSYIQYCGIYNNAAGKRSSSENMGGGIWLSGAGVIHNSVIYNNIDGGVRFSNKAKIVNCTVIHNSTSAVDLEGNGTTTGTDGNGTVYNTAIWGNTSLCKSQTSHPTFRYCAFPEVNVTDTKNGTDANGNKHISYQNFERTDSAAWFTTPTSNIGYDRSFNSLASTVPSYTVELEEQSALLASGSLDFYNSYVGNAVGTDLAGNVRYQSKTIDIGAYERERLSASRRRYVKQGATGNGTSWTDAMGDLQKAIDELADGSGRKGEVWVAKGEYRPSNRLEAGKDTPLSFAMKDGISVYGGFSGDDASETVSRRKRKGSNFWEFENETKLLGANFAETEGASKTAVWNYTTEIWNVSSSSSHVVWFAPLAGATTNFLKTTILDGFTIQGGSQQNSSDGGLYKAASQKGAGVYIECPNATLRNCIVSDNCAGKTGTSETPSQGGGVFSKYGQVRYCLVYNNSAESGGGIYVEDVGFVNSCMIANNSAKNGAGVYMKKVNEQIPDDYLILSTSIISNNTSTSNGALYVDGAGLVEQNTIVNNYTSNVIDNALDNTSRTAGLYITKKCQVINNILWNNSLFRKSQSEDVKSASLAQAYAGDEASKDNVRFYNNAISDVNAITWNRIYQSGTYSLASKYSGAGFALGTNGQYTQASEMDVTRGVQADWHEITYYWTPVVGSITRNKGLLYGQLPTDVVFKPCTDFLERNFETRPPIGAYMSDAPELVFEKRAEGTATILRIYYNNQSTNAKGNGSSWTSELASINEILANIGSVTKGSTVKTVERNAEDVTDYTIGDADNVKFEICCREGDITPAMPYTFQEYEPKSRSVQVPASTFPITILGGYPATETMESPTDADRNIKTYRTEFTGNSDGSSLKDGLFNVFRIETGAKISLDGIAITKGYASGTAFVPYGGGVLIGSTSFTEGTTDVTLRDCIIEDNYAAYGGAISMMADAKNVNLTLENCVVSNNTSEHDRSLLVSTSAREGEKYAEDIIEMGDESNKLNLYHVTIINNLGKAPAASVMGKSSFAAGNMVYDLEGNTGLMLTNANNTQTMATLGKEGAVNFSNPTKEVGAKISGNVYYGGKAEFRPTTGPKENDAIINRAVEDANCKLSLDIAGNERDLGGAPDLGAYEALLPKSGKVIYVRSYNTHWVENGAKEDCIDGTPNFNLLKENAGSVYDGMTWSRAIMGNAVCDLEAADKEGNGFYVTENDGTLMAAALTSDGNDSEYTSETGKYGPTSGAYSDFFSSTNGNIGGQKANDDNKPNASVANNTLFNQITNDRKERYVSGLQYAVEQAAAYNKAHPDEEPMAVWVGAGVYTDYKGFVIRNGVKVYGGFCKEGNPGESDRRPLLSQYVPAREQYKNLNKADYETVLQIRKETPVYLTEGKRVMWWSDKVNADGSPKDGSYYDYASKKIVGKNVERHYVLYQPDVCLPTWNVEGTFDSDAEARFGYTKVDQYRFPESGMGYDDTKYYQEYKDVIWDGFSIRHGYLINYRANRDGGAGVRVFRGINLENLIIVNNFTHGERSRGGGLYMDGMNSTIKNSYLLQNVVAASDKGAEYSGGKDAYGGGAYMLTGTGYNMVVASNSSVGGTTSVSCRGGGIFIENAKFYNNTVAYNQAKEGAGIEHWQGYATGITSALTLYNCLVFENFQDDNGSNAKQIESRDASRFQAKHCFVVGDMQSGLITNGKDGNIVYSSDNLLNPFTLEAKKGTDRRFSPVRLANDYHLNEANGLEGNPCLNGGTEEDFDIPATDMDYTDRIKDCAIDIGAYEADNSANITATEKENHVSILDKDGNVTETKTVIDYYYYVTQNGAGTRSGESPGNAACAEKLQSVLTAAGKLAQEVNHFGEVGEPVDSLKSKVYVKVAGYKTDEDGTRFVYHANTLANPDDPQSYTYLIPNGVWLMGGYYEGGEYDADGKEIPANWDNDKRDVMTEYRTVLSAKTEPKLGSAVEQEVNGYHTVTFGKWPTDETLKQYNDNALSYRATLDGVTLTDGLATDAGYKGVGGAAIVPEKAHIRNCIISGCKATQGGAVYLLPGGMVTGSILTENNAKQGGAVYAAVYDPSEGSVNFHAYVISCTIAGNTATTGGGVNQELGALMAGNTVIWGNTATSDNNVSGVVDQKFVDYVMGSVTDTKEYYPYNNCYVEKYALPANTWNREMESDLETYFASTGEYYPRPYSVLVEGGVSVEYYQAWAKMAGVLLYDILGVDRNSRAGGFVTAGAYAMTLPFRDSSGLLKRIFVSNGGGAEVSDEIKAKYLGRSFYTPFNTLDKALEYIEEMRKTTIKVSTGSSEVEMPLATDTTKFEILMSGGIYKPTTMRDNNEVTDGVTQDKRLCSFVIPVNVDIFGGFAATDPYSSNPVTRDEKGGYIAVRGDDFTSLTTLTDEAPIALKSKESIRAILKFRNSDEAHMTDQNKNGLIEPWEFANPTILSGNIKESAVEKKVYHVVYSKIADTHQSSAANNNDVMLDGITIQDGETMDALSYNGYDEDTESEIGHGGGIYSNNVSYTLNRCRVMNNIGVHGGGIYVKDGSVDIINSFIGGNWAGSESNDQSTEAGKGGGVGVYISKNDASAKNRGNFHAVNSVFVNNSAHDHTRSEASMGGAIYVWRAENTATSYHDVFVMNCIIANNNATEEGGIGLSASRKMPDPGEGGTLSKDLPIVLYNTVLWNNEDKRHNLDREDMYHCASDKLDRTATRATDGNILISLDNMSASGPRFVRPTKVVGNAGFDYMAQWNPAAISVLTDAGAGKKDADGNESGEYLEWWNLHKARLPEYGYDDEDDNYIRVATESQSRATVAYHRYLGPMDDNGVVTDKPIDIGLYEFQYNFTFDNNEAVYVGTTDEGLGDGSNWANQTSDLRGAIIAMANPRGNKYVDGSTINTNRKIYVRDGEYYSPTVSAGDAYPLHVNTSEYHSFISSLEIMGACTGNGHEQDFSKQTVLIPNEKEETPTKNLLDITTNGRPVTISGLTFENTCTLSSDEDAGVGLNISKGFYEGNEDEKRGQVVLRNCGFRYNEGNGLVVNGDLENGVLVFNTLFADGKKNGIYAKGKLQVANATFVKNEGKDILAEGTSPKVVNTVSWQNGATILQMPENENWDENRNKWFAKDVNNDDVMKGPNFVDPVSGDYRIRPSYMLLNQGGNQKYISLKKELDVNFDTDSLKVDKDLANLTRLTGDSIDIGAYECDTKLLPIIYVSSSARNYSGESWKLPTNDLQGAINLAELYANTNQASPYGYVFVQSGFTGSDININLPGVKVYGTMNGNEESSVELDGETGIKKAVSEILGKRKGVLEQGSLSTIDGLTLDFANGTKERTDGTSTTSETITNVVDGFLLNGDVKMNNGYLSTSVLAKDATLASTAAEDASDVPVLYNSLVLGQVKTDGKLRTVNVTAVKDTDEKSQSSDGKLPSAVSGSGFNRVEVTSANPYVKSDYWKYQLEETDSNIDPAENSDSSITEGCMAMVEHKMDLAGNKRIRNNVDNGCFETWDLKENYTADATDYPHGKSVVYVHEDKELKLDKDFYVETNMFSPGFLLLKHHAGLRGNGGYITLDNFAVERKLEAGKYDMCVLPFAVSAIETRDVEDASTSGDSYAVYFYSGSARAKYDYKYDATNGNAWIAGMLTGQHGTDGMMLAATRTQTNRYYGTRYEETANLKNVSLQQYNYAEEWSESKPSSIKFVHKENMGWNLFGSPYLCAMNYKDMEYGRVIYVWKDGQYAQPLNTEEQSSGYVPAFDAMFTQTATLDAYESFTVSHSDEKDGGAFGSIESLAVALSKKAVSRADEHQVETSEGDELLLNVVAPAEARNDFGMDADGVKFINSNAAQLYAIRDGGRYSLLSAVSEKGTVRVGVSLPSAGEYSFAVPEACDASQYEAVLLKDAETGKAVDLLEGSYEFDVAEAGEVNNRFSISFNRMVDEQKNAVKVWLSASKVISLSGLEDGDVVQVYDVAGQLENKLTADAESLKVRTANEGVKLVEVLRGGKQVAVKKIAVR